MHLLTPLEELGSDLAVFNISVESALVARYCVEGWALLKLFQVFGELANRLLNIAFVHVLLVVVFKLLALRRENLLALGSLDRDLWRQFKMLTATSLLSGGAHTLLDHESVHVDVGLQAATIRGVC